MGENYTRVTDANFVGRIVDLMYLKNENDALPTTGPWACA